MSEFEVFMLLWVLPSLVVLAIILLAERLLGKNPENLGDDLPYIILVSVIWPIGVVVLPFRVILSVDTNLFKMLLKERKWRN